MEIIWWWHTVTAQSVPMQFTRETFLRWARKSSQGVMLEPGLTLERWSFPRTASGQFSEIIRPPITPNLTSQGSAPMAHWLQPLLMAGRAAWELVWTPRAFNSSSGVISYPNCCLTSLNGFNTNWAYASQVAVAVPSGSGLGLYMSEGFGIADSYIALLQVNGSTGCATEAPGSPFVDAAWTGMESITPYSQ